MSQAILARFLTRETNIKGTVNTTFPYWTFKYPGSVDTFLGSFKIRPRRYAC